ncbi:sorbitol-specific phosphotransferase system component IIBC [Sporomusaceae bacterium BoRhaA]|uniref:hypothetical protein n=1 Tax=Pelorhabdus rhamnosifermentans TaxID=2772457 RepID=UPI001C06149C|nr:hypothetical protein [Pelorhabdus rhamnosifermentans]MBU2701175.1 sorbitol-specific phosphotransferase system component IIBC [Pelorhabdus rhamnosifermentans]
MLFKALKHITCQGKDYAPGDIVPGAASFINLHEMIEYRFLTYATEEEIKVYEQKEAEEAAKKAAEEKAKADAEAKKAEEAAKKEAEEAAKNKK